MRRNSGGWGSSGVLAPLPTPPYRYDPARAARLMLALECFKLHMTDEGWQLQDGLALSGYSLRGKGYYDGATDVGTIIRNAEETGHLPVGTVIVQDKREWDPGREGCFDKNAAFTRLSYLSQLPEIFKVTVCKDSHQDVAYNANAAAEMGCHAWIIYYHPDLVRANAPYLRAGHLIRTYHSIDRTKVPAYSPAGRMGCLISGALNKSVYPLRQRLFDAAPRLGIETYGHPGYHARGTASPGYLSLLSGYKVSICTASVYKYALRKIIESTAAGCRVVTDLPAFDCLPGIDGNLIRVDPSASLGRLGDVIREAVETYDPARQEHYAGVASGIYDYRHRGLELARSIEDLRKDYPANPQTS